MLCRQDLYLLLASHIDLKLAASADAQTEVVVPYHQTTKNKFTIQLKDERYYQSDSIQPLKQLITNTVK